MDSPNVIIFCSDEHARSWTSCYGHEHVQTPNLEKLSSRGTTFSRAVTPSPICVSARASLATGLQVHESRCWSSAEPYYGQHESWMHRGRRVCCEILYLPSKRRENLPSRQAPGKASIQSMTGELRVRHPTGCECMHREPKANLGCFSCHLQVRTILSEHHLSFTTCTTDANFLFQMANLRTRSLKSLIIQY